jgi:hypothetical protein
VQTYGSRMRFLLATALALAVTAAAVAAPPQRGLVLPGRSLGGVRLGATKAQVQAAWGVGHGVCRGCATPTWYFTYKKFAPEGAAAEFNGGRVSALYTLWQPVGWHTDRNLLIGDNEARITGVYGPLTKNDCDGYSALLLPRGGATTAFYVVDGKLWGFGLIRSGAPACR